MVHGNRNGVGGPIGFDALEKKARRVSLLEVTRQWDATGIGINVMLILSVSILSIQVTVGTWGSIAHDW